MISYLMRRFISHSRSPSSQVENRKCSIGQIYLRNQYFEEATWESEEDMKKIYTHLFESVGDTN